MRWSLVKTIFLKEFRDILRDRRTLFVMIVLPILLYPLLMIGFTQVAAIQVSKIAEKKSRVVVLGEQNARAFTAIVDTLPMVLRQDTVEWRGRLARSEIEAAVQFSAGFADSVSSRRAAEVTIYFNSSKEASEQARKRLERTFERLHQQVVASRLEALSSDTTLLHAYAIQNENIATSEQQQGAFIGKLLGYMIIIMTLMGAFYPAIDLTAGEKERGTLETLLVSPANRSEIVFGKFLTVAVISLITASLNILSIGVSMAYIYGAVGGGGAMGPLSMNPLSLVMSYLLILPLVVTFAALCIAIAVSARTYKEGQSLLSPLYTVVILPAMVSLVPGAEITPTLAAIPIVNVSLLIKEYMMGHFPWTETAIAFGSSSLLAALALSWATSQFKQESVIFRHAEDVRWSPFRSRRRIARSSPYPTPGSALILIMVQIILLFQMNMNAAEWGIPKLLLITEFVVILLPPLWILYRGRYDIPQVLRLKPPRPSVWPATLLLIFGGWLTSLELATLQHHFFPFPDELLEQFTELFKSLDSLPMIASIFLIAILPGICEELLCRGFLLSAFRLRFGNAGAIVLAALLFGILHMNPYRLLPTVFLGLLLGLIAFYSGSIFPAMLAHATSNTLSFFGEKYQDWISAHLFPQLTKTEFLPWPLVLFGLVLIAAGVLWLKRTYSEPPLMPVAVVSTPAISEDEH